MAVVTNADLEAASVSDTATLAAEISVAADDLVQRQAEENAEIIDIATMAAAETAAAVAADIVEQAETKPREMEGDLLWLREQVRQLSLEAETTKQFQIQQQETMQQLQETILALTTATAASLAVSTASQSNPSEQEGPAEITEVEQLPTETPENPNENDEAESPAVSTPAPKRKVRRI